MEGLRLARCGQRRSGPCGVRAMGARDVRFRYLVVAILGASSRRAVRRLTSQGQLCGRLTQPWHIRGGSRPVPYNRTANVPVRRRATWRLRNPVAARRRWHGRGLQSARHATRPHGRDQGPASHARRPIRSSVSGSTAKPAPSRSSRIRTSAPCTTSASTQGTAFLVMEYLEGETLADRLAKGALPLDQALQTAIEIASALEKAHRAGIVHRDLKPGNIMLTKSGAKLLDFGLAKVGAPCAGGSSAVDVADDSSQPHGAGNDPRDVSVHGAGATRRERGRRAVRTSLRSARCCTRWSPARRRSTARAVRASSRRSCCRIRRRSPPASR